MSYDHLEEIFEKYENVLEDIYNKQTRGDFTWWGVLSAFLRDIEGQDLTTEQTTD